MNFYEMLTIMEQDLSSASVERFPQDFEQVLNFIAGGPWNFITNEWSPFVSVDKDKSTNVWFFFMRAEYRGMSESGRHYKLSVKLNNVPAEPIKGDALNRMKRWKQEFVSYNPMGSPSVYFQLEEIKELGADTNSGRELIASSEQEENPTSGQEEIHGMLAKLKKIQDDLNKDFPKPKWTPERTVYRRDSENPIKNARLVDLAKQIRDEIAEHEKKNTSFSLY